MFNKILDKFANVLCGEQFFLELATDIANEYGCDVAIWQVESDQYKLQVSSFENIENLNNWMKIKSNTSLYTCIDQLKLTTGSEYKLSGMPHIKKIENCCFALIPWTSAGKIRAVLSLHKESQDFVLSELEMIHTLLINLADLANKSWLKISNKNYLWLQGTPTSPGVVLGQCVLIDEMLHLEDVVKEPLDDYSKELKSLSVAFENLQQDMDKMSKDFNKAEKEQADIFAAYKQMTSRHGLMRDIVEYMQKNQLSAISSLKMVVDNYIKQFKKIQDPYLKTRIIDIKDIGQRVFFYLNSESTQDFVYPEKTILVGSNLTLFDLAEVPVDKLVGVVSIKGSKYSHVGIVARSLGIPAVTGDLQVAIKELDKKNIFLDGYLGKINIEPKDLQLKEFEQRIIEDKKLATELAKLRLQPAKTSDDYVVSVFGNIGLGVDLQFALTAGVDGIGLFRSELSFMTYEHFPSVDVQITVYKKLLKSLAPKPVIMCTLDFGGDKPLPYLLHDEENTSLGWRGLRFCMYHPEVLFNQLYAMIAASSGLKNLHILIPMIISYQEIVVVKNYLTKAFELCKSEGLDVVMPAFGVMIETPAAALQINVFATVVDFFTVGSNDLVQYMLAVDRNNEKVSHLFDSFNPAVLNLLQKIVDDAKINGKHVSICGEFAADPMGAVLLVAMGYDSLSISAAGISKIKWVLSKFSLADCENLLKQSLSCRDSKSVISLLKYYFKINGVGRLIGMNDVDN